MTCHGGTYENGDWELFDMEKKCCKFTDVIVEKETIIAKDLAVH